MASYADDFDRTNGEIGANWIEDEGDIDIVSNIAVAQTAPPAFNRARYASALDGPDQIVEALIVYVSGTDVGGITARQASATNTSYAGIYVEPLDAGGIRLSKLVAGGETELDSALAPTGNITLTLTVDGATQTLDVETVELCSAADGAITEGNYAGLLIWGNNGRWDDWSAEDVGGEPPAAIAPVFIRRAAGWRR